MLKRVGFVVMLPAVMTSGTYAAVMMGVLAVEIIDEFSVQRWQIGLLIMVAALLGGLLSPVAGRGTDLVGARHAALFTISVGAISILLTAGAFSYVFLFVAAVLSGITNSLVNPVTNKLISQHVPTSRQGIITGVKQSGVQFGSMMSGLILPVATLAWGWRWAVAVCALFPLVVLVIGLLSLPPDATRREMAVEVASYGKLPAVVKRLGVYAFLMGTGGVCILTYLPLYAQEKLGLSYAAAGGAVALSGMFGVASRIAAGMTADRLLGFRPLLLLMAGLSLASALLLASAETIGASAIWITAALAGIGAVSWNSVAMLAVIQLVPASVAGRGSGVVVLGFLSGVGVGAPLFGWSVDLWNSYLPGWLAVCGLFVGGGLIMVKSRLSPVTAPA